MSDHAGRKGSTKRVVIVGTGTGIGKTHLGVALVAAAARRAISVCGLKPIESGVPTGAVGEDAEALARVGLFHVKLPQPYALPDPVSPHLAARRAGIQLDLTRVQTWVDAHAASLVLIETAGGLLSPLSPGTTNLDLAQSLAPDAWVLVAPDRLGVLHDVTACMLALRVLCSPSVTPLVVLQPPATPDDSTGTNARELVHLRIAPTVLAMPRNPVDAEDTLAVAGDVLGALGLNLAAARH